MSTLFSFLALVSFVLLIVGLLNPKAVRKIVRSDSRKRIALIFGSALFLLLVLGGATAETPIDNKATEKITQTTLDKVPEPVVENQQAAEPPKSTSSTDKPQVIYYAVTKVIDGDTIEVSIDGKIERIRQIGINTPETVDPRSPVECFGIEASNQAKKLLSGKSVALETDSTQGERDKYNRLLRYVFLVDGTNFGEKMIRDGFAHEYTYSTPYKYQALYKAAQAETKTAKRGLWADGACQKTATDTTTSGNVSSEPTTSSPSTTQTSPESSTSSAPTTTESTPSEPTSPTPPPPTTTANCSCSSNSYNCGDFSTHAEAQTIYECCMAEVGYDVHKLDADSDRDACETLP